MTASNDKINQNLPEDWELVKLGEVIEKIRNGFVYSLHDIKNEGIPITRIETISQGFIDKNKLRFISVELCHTAKDYIMEIGDILITHINSLEHVGKTAIYKGDPPVLIHGMNLLLIRTKKIFLSPFFLIYVLNKHDIRHRIKNLSGQAVNQVSIKVSDLQSLLIIPLPPLPEQEKIAEILQTIDNAIEKTDKIIEKYERIKKGLMQDLLTKGIDENWQIRSEKTHKFKESPLGKIPTEWQVERLGKVLIFKNGKSPKFSEEELYPIYGSNGLIGYTDDYFLDGAFILVGRVGASGEIHLIEGKFWASDNCLIGKFTDIINPLYIYFMLHFIDLKRFITQTAQPLITQSFLNNLQIPLPPLPEQERIVKVISQIDEVVEKEKAFKRKLERIKKGLMEDLLTGKVRVNKLIKEVKNDEKRSSI